MTTCLAFINTILIATEDFDERVRLRNEFAGERSEVREIKYNCFGQSQPTKAIKWANHNAKLNIGNRE